MLSFECIKNEKSVYFLLTSAVDTLLDILFSHFRKLLHFILFHHIQNL